MSRRQRGLVQQAREHKSEAEDPSPCMGQNELAVFDALHAAKSHMADACRALLSGSEDLQDPNAISSLVLTERALAYADVCLATANMFETTADAIEEDAIKRVRDEQQR